MFATRILAVIFSISSVHCSISIASSSPLATTKYIYNFGDSYTTSAYDLTTGRYNFSQPLTQTGGTTYIQELATASNAKLFNYAAPLAAISNTIVGFKSTPDFSQQVTSFIAANPQSKNSWTADNALFTIWFGSEDIGFAYAAKKDFTLLQPALLTKMDAVVALLHSAGARRFLFLEIPPVEQTPLSLSLGPAAVAEIKRGIDFWNARLKIYNQYFSTIYSNSIAYNYDPYPFLNQLIINGKANGFTNTTGFCADYAKVANNPEISLPQCGVPASQYIWHDPYNLAFRPSLLLAADIITSLNNGSLLTSPQTPAAVGVATSSTPASVVTAKPAGALTPSINSSAPLALSTGPTTSTSVVKSASASSSIKSATIFTFSIVAMASSILLI